MISIFYTFTKFFSSIKVQLWLMISIILLFFSNNLLVFFLFFETRVLILILLINLKRGGTGRYLGSRRMLLYSTLGSIPLLIRIITINKQNIICWRDLIFRNNVFLIYFFIIAIVIKFPLYLFHLWLPKTHVYASTEGSIILAAIVLKVGFYLLILIKPVLKTMNYAIFSLAISIRLIGCVISGIICIRQTHIKSYIAYSSISHMSFGFIVTIISSRKGLIGVLLLMISHGIVSCTLFYLAGIMKKISSNYNLIINKRILNNNIYSKNLLFMIIICNMGAPLTISIYREIDRSFKLTSNFFGLVLLFCVLRIGSYQCINLYLITTQRIKTNYRITNSSEDNIQLLTHFVSYLVIGLIYLILRF